MREGVVIGTVSAGQTSASGFHFTLIKQPFYKRYREIKGSKYTLGEKSATLDAELSNLEKLMKTIALGQNERQLEKHKIVYKKLETQLEEVDKKLELLQTELKDNFDNWFIDPIGSMSPVNCPGAGKVLYTDSTKTNPEGVFIENPLKN